MSCGDCYWFRHPDRGCHNPHVLRAQSASDFYSLVGEMIYSFSPVCTLFRPAKVDFGTTNTLSGHPYGN